MDIGKIGYRYNWIKGQMDRKTAEKTSSRTDGERQTYRVTDGQRERWIGRLTDGHIDKHSEGQTFTGAETNKQTYGSD